LSLNILHPAKSISTRDQFIELMESDKVKILDEAKVTIKMPKKGDIWEFNVGQMDVNKGEAAGIQMREQRVWNNDEILAAGDAGNDAELTGRNNATKNPSKSNFLQSLTHRIQTTTTVQERSSQCT